MNPMLNRRQFVQNGALSLGSVALASLMNAQTQAAPHFAPRAKRIIYLFMHGGPSQLDLFDYKPELKKRHG